MPEKDHILVRRTLGGDREAFGDLVERYGGLVRGVLMESMRRPEEVEDLAQDVFCKAYEDLGRLREPGKFASWLARIATNAAMAWLRRQQVRTREETRERVIQLALPPRLPDQIVEADEMSQALWAALDHLSPINRQVVVLFHLEQCSYQDIARFLDIGMATVRMRLFRARSQLRRELEAAHYQDYRPTERKAMRRKVLAGLPVLALPTAEVEALPWWQGLPVPAAKKILLVCFAGSVLLHLLGFDLIGSFWRGAENTAEIRLHLPAQQVVEAELLAVRRPDSLTEARLGEWRGSARPDEPGVDAIEVEQIQAARDEEAFERNLLSEALRPAAIPGLMHAAGEKVAGVPGADGSGDSTDVLQGWAGFYVGRVGHYVAGASGEVGGRRDNWHIDAQGFFEIVQPPPYAASISRNRLRIHLDNITREITVTDPDRILASGVAADGRQWEYSLAKHRDRIRGHMKVWAAGLDKDVHPTKWTSLDVQKVDPEWARYLRRYTVDIADIE